MTPEEKVSRLSQKVDVLIQMAQWLIDHTEHDKVPHELGKRAPKSAFLLWHSRNSSNG